MRRLALTLALLAAACSGASSGPGGRDLANALGFADNIGAICGDPRILGIEIGRVPGSGACGIEDAVRVHAVGDVILSPSARINCSTATALRHWMETSAQPAARKAGTRG